MESIKRLEQDTIVTFPSGKIKCDALVIATHVLSKEKLLVITDKSPFHPVDHLWPDQPSDEGYIVVDKKTFSIIDCVTVAINIMSQELLINEEIKDKGIKRNHDGWIWVVGHIIELPKGKVLEKNILNLSVKLIVDKSKRNALSQAHSLCHYAALALNKVLTDTLENELWRKGCAIKDSFGNNDFDQIAITSSRISEWESVDQYRVGKSLRRKSGINIKLVLDNLMVIREHVQLLLNNWVEINAGCFVRPSICGLSVPREWVAQLEGREVVIPCGGTHLTPNSQREVKTSITSLGCDSFEMKNIFVERIHNG